MVSDIEAAASKGRLLFLIDGLDEITGVAALASLTPKFAPEESLSPLELVQSLLSSRLAPGSHIIVTSRPHTLTYLQVTFLGFGDIFPFLKFFWGRCWER